MNRQQVRKVLLFWMFVTLPITLIYISPLILISGASEGVVTGSMILMSITFISSLFLGRFWCGWFCPTGGEQEFCTEIQRAPVSGGKYNYIKYVVWLLWIVVVVSAILGSEGLHSINILYKTNSGISITKPIAYIVYFIIIGIIFLFAVLFGKRGFCHYLCPICVNLIIGRKIRGLFNWPALHLKADKTRCISCNKCSQVCSMGLSVHEMITEGRMEEPECILCAACADICPKGAISYGFR